MLPIRANAGTVINKNSPDNARELLAYYNREQYPETKLFYGSQFTDLFGGLDEDQPYMDDKPKYEEDEATGKYVIVNNWKNAKQNSSDEHKTFLPRMWNTAGMANYMQFVGRYYRIFYSRRIPTRRSVGFYGDSGLERIRIRKTYQRRLH